MYSTVEQRDGDAIRCNLVFASQKKTDVEVGRTFSFTVKSELIQDNSTWDNKEVTLKPLEIIYSVIIHISNSL